MARPKKYSTGPPVAATMPPGQCQFTEEWTPCKLLEVAVVSHNVKVFSFETPDPAKPLGLSTCACILARGQALADGAEVVRPYTPVSTNAVPGRFDLMVKVYPDGKMSTYLDSLPIGSPVDFKHIPPNVKIQYPFGHAHVGMLVGGTGITPMVQALHAVLGNPADETRVSMLVGNQSQDDILARETLDTWAAEHPGRLSVTHVLSREPEGSPWPGHRGFISRELVEKYMPPPGSDCKILVCGPPPMYAALCGPRDQPELSGVLKDMGYKKEQVYKF